MTTRSLNTRSSILPTLPDESNQKIAGTRLPTYQQVLLCFLATMDKQREVNKSKYNQKLVRLCANSVVDEVLSHYNNAKIALIQKHKMAEKVEALHNEYKNLIKLNPKRRKGSKAVATFQDKLLMTMPFWPRNVLTIMEESKRGKNENEKNAIAEDISFLKSMMTDRVASYQGKDLLTTRAEKLRLERQQKERHRIEATLLGKCADNEFPLTFSGSESSSSEIECEPSTSRSHKRMKKTGTTIFIPHNVLKSPLIVSTAVRNKISSTALSATLHSVIEACQGDATRVNLHQSQSQR